MDKILAKYPDRVPIYIEKSNQSSSDIPDLEKS